MHRSGTSTVTRLLGLAGAPLPRGAGRGRSSNPANPKGFWEVPSLSRCNEDVLRALDGDWSAPPLLHGGWPLDARLAHLRRRADRLAHRHLERPGVVWKDPRLCLLLPFWERVVPRGAPVVLVVRNPLEVAASMHTRNGIDPVVGLALWERYLRSALALSAGRPAYVVRYEQAVDHPGELIRSARAWMGAVGLPTRPVGPDEQAAAFVSETLRRNRRDDAEVEVDPSMSESQRALHRAVVALVGRHDHLTAPPIPPPDPASDQLLEIRREQRQTARPRTSWRRRGRRWALERLSELARSRRGTEP
jgi:hypothetical protein